MTTEKGGRPRLAVGHYGQIAVQQVGPSRYRARARYRGLDGATKPVARFGQTKTAARTALLAELDRRRRGDVTLGHDTPLRAVLTEWLTEVNAEGRAKQTESQYRYFVDRYIEPRIGDLTVGEATTGRCDRVVQAIRDEHGASVARSVRTVLRLAFSYAIRQGAISLNPIRETRPVRVPQKRPRGLTKDQVEDITDHLRSDERAVRLDLPDLVDMALATGCRIGELLAVRQDRLELDRVYVPGADLWVPGTLTVDATVIRPRGEPLQIQEHAKGRVETGEDEDPAEARVIALPSYAVEMLRRRLDEMRFQAQGVVFPSPTRPTLRDPSNCAGDLREVMQRICCPACLGGGWHPGLKTARENAHRPKGVPLCDGKPPYSWVTSHTFRKTVVTTLLAKGATPAEAADQVGHRQVSMTLNVYTARGSVSPRAAELLDR